MKKFWLFIWELAKMVIISLAIVLPIRYFLIQPFYVKGASMEPNFHDHEYLIIDEITYRFNEPQRGDIVVFRYPHNPQEYFIKRVVGLPGETIEIKDGALYLYNQAAPGGVKLAENYLANDVTTYSYQDGKVTIPEGYYYMLGDNRLASKDSRTFGPVAKKFIIGRVVFRGWPLNKLGVLKGAEY